MDTKRMIRFAIAAYGRSVVEEAWREFCLWDEEAPPYDAATPHQQLFAPWFLYRWKPGILIDTSIEDSRLRGVPPAAVFMTRHAYDLDDAARTYVEQCLSTPLSFHEILAADAGGTLKTRDLLTGKECGSCHIPRPYPKDLRPSDIVYGQCVQIGDIAQFEACAPVAISASRQSEILKRAGNRGPTLHVSPVYRARHHMRMRAMYFELAGKLMADIPEAPHLQAVL